MGIYATWIHGVGNGPIAGVSSLGTRPTVNGREPLLEAHLFDFDGDLYGKHLRVEFVCKLRDEEKFDDLAALVQQMDRNNKGPSWAPIVTSFSGITSSEAPESLQVLFYAQKFWCS